MDEGDDHLAPPRRVLVSGISGAGKSTLARHLAVHLDLPYVEFDALHHGPGCVKRPDFEADVEALAARDRWITEDQYQSFIGDLLWRRADTLVWLDLPRPTVMSRVNVRTFSRLLTRRRIFNGNRERWRDLPTKRHPIRWAWSRHASRRARTEQLVAAHPHLRAITLHTAADADEWRRNLTGMPAP